MWRSRVHKVREFESSISYNKSLLKSISREKHNKGMSIEKIYKPINDLVKANARLERVNNKLFLKMCYARYIALDYGQNQDKDRIHNYGKQILHFALRAPIYLAKYLLIFAKPIMIAIGVFLMIICSGRGRKTRRDKMGRGKRKWDTENLDSI